MSVTVIATGIGEKDKQPVASPKVMDPTYGGKVRDITPPDGDPSALSSGVDSRPTDDG